jgi:O-antigen ligase
METLRSNKILIFLVLAELLSISAFLLPVGSIFFAAILILFIYLSAKDLKNGLYIIFAELFIGSLGYLFWLDLGDFRLSIRVGLWTSFMAVWFFKLILQYIGKNKNSSFFSNEFKLKFYSSLLFYKLLLIFFIIWGVINGILNNNGLGNIFFDANGWIFFGLIFPIYHIINQEKDLDAFISNFKLIFKAAIIWISAKTLILLYLFSHNFPNLLPFFYKWVRDTRVGEITQMESGFVRIFFQSYIFAIAGFFIFFFLHLYFKYKENNKKSCTNYLYSTVLLLSVAIISFSRSNWLGMGMGMLPAAYIIWQNFRGKNILKPIYGMVLIFVFSIVLIVSIIGFPFPSTKIQNDAAGLLMDRASNLSDEAGASSRWNLLPVLWGEIKDSPVAGKGFGSTVSYISNDPRVREQNESGEYTTYAVEWGWLGIWLKLGIFGLFSYLMLVYMIFKRGFGVIKKEGFFNQKSLFIAGVLTGLFSLVMINVFSPYFDHPLGIGYLLFAAILIEAKIKETFPLAKN